MQGSESRESYHHRNQAASRRRRKRKKKSVSKLAQDNGDNSSRSNPSAGCLIGGKPNGLMKPNKCASRRPSSPASLAVCLLLFCCCNPLSVQFKLFVRAEGINKTTVASVAAVVLSSSSSPLQSSAQDAAVAAAAAATLQQQQETSDEEGSLLVAIIIANIVIFVIGFCGNSLVILVILKFTRIETVTDIYILNLAFADLMFLLGLVFLTTTMLIDHWIFGNLMCKLYMATTSLNQFASSLLLVVMSFDRFLAVCHPIYAQRFRRLRRAKIICLCIWITCLILMTPIFAFAKTDPITRSCAIFWPEYESFNCEIAFTLYSFAIGFACPLLLIAAFYTCVIRKLRKAVTGPASTSSSRRSRARETTNRRIEHLVIGIICTYTICWLPYWIAQLCVSLNAIAKLPWFYQFFMIGSALTYTNSALNPILYAFLSDNFKRRCSDVFSSIVNLRLWCQKRSCFSDSRPQTIETNIAPTSVGGCSGSVAAANKLACCAAGSLSKNAPPDIDMQHTSCFKQPDSRQTTTVILNDLERKTMLDLQAI